MQRVVDDENKIVFFEGSWPGVMAIPIIMKREYPDYSHKVVSCLDFNKLKQEYK